MLWSPNNKWRRLVTAIVAVVFVLLNTMPVKAGDEYFETWQAKQYRAVKLILPNPAKYIPPTPPFTFFGKTSYFAYDANQPDFETQWICLGVAEWEVNFSKDGQSITESWGADNDSEHWRNYYPTDPSGIASPGSNGQPRHIKAQFSNVDTCNNTTGYWVEAVWNYQTCFITDGQTSCFHNEAIGPDRYMLYNIGQYALLGEIGGRTDENSDTLGANYLYPFNIRSEPVKWNVIATTN
ncbi:MAG: hypothetical protein Q7S64_03410 [bacterium]|nr:hypothetical protein [bacterium]